MDVELRPLGEDDLEQVIHVRATSYGPVADRQRTLQSLGWRMPYSLGAFVGGRLRSMSFMFPLAAWVGGRKTTVAGLSGVATAPEARRQGLVARSLRRWFALLHDQGIGWSAEHPFDPTFYARLGYQTVPNGHTLELPLARLRASTRAGPGRSEGIVAEPVGAEAVADMARVHAAFASRFSFALARDDGLKDHWAWTLRRPWEPLAQFAYAAEDAYAVFTVKEPEKEDGDTVLHVRDLAWSSPAGRRRVFALLAGYEGQVGAVRLHLPAGDPVALDWSAWHTVESPELQVRVVDVKVALEGLTWPEEARLTLRVADPDCDWNDGTFALELGPGGAGVARADAAEPDAALDVGALAALLTGASPPASLLTDGRAEGSLPALRALAGALREHPVFKSHNDHF